MALKDSNHHNKGGNKRSDSYSDFSSLRRTNGKPALLTLRQIRLKPGSECITSNDVNGHCIPVIFHMEHKMVPKRSSPVAVLGKGTEAHVTRYYRMKRQLMSRTNRQR